MPSFLPKVFGRLIVKKLDGSTLLAIIWSYQNFTWKSHVILLLLLQQALNDWKRLPSTLQSSRRLEHSRDYARGDARLPEVDHACEHWQR